MPELPEVETVVRGLRSSLPGRSIVDVRFGKTDFVDDPAAIAERLPGAEVAGVARLGKFISIELKPGANGTGTSPQFSLLVHLGMTGQLRVASAGAPSPPHTHCHIGLDDGRELRYTDIRRFGRMRLLPHSSVEDLKRQLGEEPLEVSPEEFCKYIGSRRARVKALLLDQKVLRGIGNIYADESLFLARLHPARIGQRLTRKQLLTLHRAIRQVLADAIRYRGSSISDYVDSEGNRGEFHLRHKVYQREGERCFHCGAKIHRIIVAGRSSHFCPRCQPAPRGKSSSK